MSEKVCKFDQDWRVVSLIAVVSCMRPELCSVDVPGLATHMLTVCSVDVPGLATHILTVCITSRSSSIRRSTRSGNVKADITAAGRWVIHCCQ